MNAFGGNECGFNEEAIGSALTFTRKHRGVSQGNLTFTRKHRGSTSVLQFTRKHRGTCTNTLTFTRKHRGEARSSLHGDSMRGSDPGDYAVTLTAYKSGSTKTIERGTKLEIELNESAPAQWWLDIWDEDGLYAPENTSSAWYDWLGHRPFNAAGTAYLRKFLASITYGGATLSFVGIPTAAPYRHSDDDGNIFFRWSGQDVSYILFRDAQNRATIRSTRNSLVYARTIAADILDAYGVAHNLSGLENYVVPVMHRQNAKPITWLAGGPISLLGVPVAEWQIVGETFTPYRPVVAGVPHFTYNFGSSYGIDMQVNASDPGQVVNVLTGIRAREIGEVSKTEEPETWGQYTVTFDAPLNAVAWTVLVQTRGLFSNFEGYDPSGKLVAANSSRAGTYPTSINNAAFYNIKTLKYTWGAPSPTIQALGNAGAYGKIIFTGQPADNPDVFGSTFDTTFTYTEDQSTATSGKYVAELPPNPLIPDSVWLTRHVQRMLAKMQREQRTTSAKVPLNLLLRPGMTVREVGGRANVDRTVYVKRVRHTFGQMAGSCSTQYEAVQY